MAKRCEGDKYETIREEYLRVAVERLACLVPLAQCRHYFLSGLHQPLPQLFILTRQPLVFLQSYSESILSIEGKKVTQGM